MYRVLTLEPHKAIYLESTEGSSQEASPIKKKRCFSMHLAIMSLNSSLTGMWVVHAHPDSNSNFMEEKSLRDC